jgi:hypothetical protein
MHSSLGFVAACGLRSAAISPEIRTYPGSPLQSLELRMRFVPLSRRIQTVVLLLAGTLVLTVPLSAQLQLGDNLSLHASGTLSAGYSGDYGNLTSSDHSIGVGGTGTISGYYYNPNFLNFTATPYYSQARDNSSSLSLSDSSGFTSQVQLFGGSRFPASISYSKSYNTSGSLDVPGLANFTTHGNSDSLGLSWAARLSGLPSLSVSFQKTGSQNSIFGSDKDATSSGQSFNLNTSYNWAGFNLGGAFYLGSSSSEYPQLLAGGPQVTSTSATDHGYTFTTSHRLPWNGSVYANYNNSTVDTSYLSTSSTYTVGNFNAAASFQPTQKLQLSGGMAYSDNLSGTIEQAVLAAGGVVTTSLQSAPSHSFDFTGAASYRLITNMQVQAAAERRTQEYNGRSTGGDAYDAGVNYWHYLFGGRFSSTVILEDATTDGTTANSLGFNINGSFNRRIGAWHVDSSVHYDQNVQTLLITSTTSQYGYGASLGRRWGIYNWSLSGGVSSSGLTGQSGTTSQSKSVSTGLGIGHWANLGGSYSESSGNGILTASGIVSTPPGVPVPPATAVLLFGGKSYSYSVGSTPVHRLTLSAAYSHADSNTGSGLASSINTTKIFNTLIQYQFRKMYLTGGFSQLTQGFSASTTPAQTVSSFFIGISRWFNFF